MKKTLKKLIAVLLVTLIIALCMPLQSFAIFDSFKVPVIETIEFNENAQPISFKAVGSLNTPNAPKITIISKASEPEALQIGLEIESSIYLKPA